MNALGSFLERRRAAREIGRRIGRDWFHAAPGFESAMDFLLGNPDAVAAGTNIWEHGSNQVYRLTLPAECGGHDIVYKHTRGKRRWNRAFSASASVREATNLLALSRLGFPMVELLAVGEKRTPGWWSEAFLVTRFAAGYRDGRHLLPGFESGDDMELRDAFLREALSFLARLHRFRVFHKGYKVYNMLWRPAGGGVELRFLDVASCRFLPWRLPVRYAVRDLGNFLEPFAFPEETLRFWLRRYLECDPGTRAGEDELFGALGACLAGGEFNWEQARRST